MDMVLIYALFFYVVCGFVVNAQHLREGERHLLTNVAAASQRLLVAQGLAAPPPGTAAFVRRVVSYMRPCMTMIYECMSMYDDDVYARVYVYMYACFGRDMKCTQVKIFNQTLCPASFVSFASLHPCILHQQQPGLPRTPAVHGPPEDRAAGSGVPCRGRHQRMQHDDPAHHG